MEDDGVSRRIGRGTFLGFVRSVWHFLRGKSMGRRG